MDGAADVRPDEGAARPREEAIPHRPVRQQLLPRSLHGPFRQLHVGRVERCEAGGLRGDGETAHRLPGAALAGDHGGAGAAAERAGEATGVREGDAAALPAGDERGARAEAGEGREGSEIVRNRDERHDRSLPAPTVPRGVAGAVHEVSGGGRGAARVRRGVHSERPRGEDERAVELPREAADGGEAVRRDGGQSHVLRRGRRGVGEGGAEERGGGGGAAVRAEHAELLPEQREPSLRVHRLGRSEAAADADLRLLASAGGESRGDLRLPADGPSRRVRRGLHRRHAEQSLPGERGVAASADAEVAAGLRGDGGGREGRVREGEGEGAAGRAHVPSEREQRDRDSVPSSERRRSRDVAAGGGGGPSRLVLRRARDADGGEGELPAAGVWRRGQRGDREGKRALRGGAACERAAERTGVSRVAAAQRVDHTGVQGGAGRVFGDDAEADAARQQGLHVRVPRPRQGDFAEGDGGRGRVAGEQLAEASLGGVRSVPVSREEQWQRPLAEVCDDAVPSQRREGSGVRGAGVRERGRSHRQQVLRRACPESAVPANVLDGAADGRCWSAGAGLAEGRGRGEDQRTGVLDEPRHVRHASAVGVWRERRGAGGDSAGEPASGGVSRGVQQHGGGVRSFAEGAVRGEGICGGARTPCRLLQHLRGRSGLQDVLCECGRAQVASDADGERLLGV